ncbi:sugar transferase [Ancylomarina euxinus]|uniref:Sugar transferase n=1 Tax=Ancylomarina euxinus TaxID=2283627 RepID=A0A425XWQ8_9BACT|nr:sugar transferase [Ancylomarina euxinus]MCZ4696336.1 sugar transferase [Ancylomarina euxinus]MUP16763.1 sugar transferase [Ancylomarina euxinus]RRG19083.1 sugar transferase [Ancylomarina euxinus]
MYKHFFKRLIDFTASLVALLILSPLLIPVVIGLLLTGEHYVFYSQKRVGYKNERFQILKFATMLKNSPNMGTGSLTLRKDPRVLPMGGFLRQTKINELPQIINTFIGNMTIVGPRPQMEVDFYKFPKSIQDVIYNAKPGITGIGSVVFRDEEKMMTNAGGDPHEFYETHIAPYKGELEVWYQENLTFMTDFKIIFLTAWVIIFPESKLMETWFKDLPDLPEALKI